MVTKYADRIAHYGLESIDIEKTKKFYTGLGFDVTGEETFEGIPVAYLEAGSIRIETYQYAEPAENPCGGIDHIGLACTDIVSCYKDLKAAGCYKFKEDLFIGDNIGYTTIWGVNGEAIEFTQTFKSEEEKARILKGLD